MEWARVYQNKIANFIRTGDPNGFAGHQFMFCILYLGSDWSNSPNVGLKDLGTNRVKWTQYAEGKGSWFQAGDNKFGKLTKDPKRQKCDMFDKINAYMKH